MAKKKEEVEAGSRLQATLDSLNKTYGAGTVLTLDSEVQKEYEVISSGSIGLDYIALGPGGYVKGKLYEFMGWEGTGKSTLCGHAVANCQKKGGVALYIDGEHALNKEYFQRLGVDTTKMLIAQPSFGEEGFGVVKKIIAEGGIDMCIIDSDSSLIPKAVYEGEVGDSNIGKKAKLNNNVYPIIKGLLSQKKVCVIVVSQFREKIGVMFGNPTTTQGGNVLKYYADCRVEIARGALEKDGDDTTGMICKIKVTKNKMGNPYRKCEFDIIFGQGIDSYKEVVDLGVSLDIITKTGSWYSYEDTKIGQGINGVRDLLKDNPELFEEIREKIIIKLKANRNSILISSNQEEV